MTEEKQKKHNGCLLLVIGASGVGKDSLLKGIEQRYADNEHIVFLRRVITRPCNPDNEVHETLSKDDFVSAKSRGAFAVTWTANGNYYGLPSSSLDMIEDGKLVIANGSRGAIKKIRAAYPSLKIVLITASADTIKQRLMVRERDTPEQIAQRLERNAELDIEMGQDFHRSTLSIDNNGALSEAIQVLSRHIDKLLPSD